MKEMLIAGRGGQGVVLASQLLAYALARAGYWVQSFPEFRAERRGAPISAFLRWDPDSPIHRRYKVHECDVLAVVSASPPSPQLVCSVRPGGLIVLNRDTRFKQGGDFTVARVPASRIACRHNILSSEGRPMANSAVLGACMRYLLPGGLRFLEEAVGARMGPLAGANIMAAREGYACCIRQHRLAGDAPVASRRRARRRSSRAVESRVDGRSRSSYRRTEGPRWKAHPATRARSGDRPQPRRPARTSGTRPGLSRSRRIEGSGVRLP